ncbi:MAG TPA: efflux RND transporter periplasmic adaptor subunit [Vitreimonas sp.]|nr:efflux RND transporter periplasmic adaptor subunit [Vitreimonas sp.]
MFAALRERVLALWAKRPGFLRGRSLYLSAGAALVVLLVGWTLLNGDSDAEPYRTAAVDRGAITRVVSATGTLQPLVSANVGSTVSGPVQSVSVDFNSQVRAGQELARLDPTPFQQRIVQAQAQLAQAQAQAAVANSDYQRYALLQQRGFASPQLMAQQRAARDTARAAVQAAAAQVATARTDLERSVIRSPIDGVVVDRQVNVGQPVASSLQAATLFVIAQDLSRLQANITVDEADIGDVEQGMPVKFTVDAFPDREFDGRVSQVRQQGVAEQGVVSYTVVVEADNPGRQLLPGMTANAEIVIEQRDNVLRVPNTALRFRPADPQIAARADELNQGRRARDGEAQAQTRGESRRGRGEGGGRGGRGIAQLTEQLELNETQQAAAQQAYQSAMQSAARPGEGATQSERRAFMRSMRDAALRAIEPTLSERQRQLLTQMREGGTQREVRRQAVVWVLRNNQPQPVEVEIGVADNANTILHSGLEEGDEVIVGGGPRAEEDDRRGGPFGGGRGPRIRGG